MKQLLVFLFSLLFLVQCASEEKKEMKSKTTYLKSELLEAYAVSDLDSVWSVSTTLQSEDSVVVNYVVELAKEGVTYTDSLPFSLVPNEETNGRIIFSNCNTRGEKPTLTSKVKRLE